MRFAAVVPEDQPMPATGDRIIVPADWITEEWDTSSTGWQSQAPRAATGDKPRPGVVCEPGYRARKRWGERQIICDDAPDQLTSTAVLISTISGKMLCQFVELSAFLDWLADRSLRTEQLPNVADRAAPWLRELFPEIADVARHAPSGYDTEAEYLAWADGVAAVLGGHRLVPVPPGGRVDAGPSLLDDAEAVIEDARRRLSDG